MHERCNTASEKSILDHFASATRTCRHGEITERKFTEKKVVLNRSDVHRGAFRVFLLKLYMQRDTSQINVKLGKLPPVN